MFGGLSIHHSDRSPVKLPPQQTSSLLAYLALRVGRSTPREELAALLWPESEPEKAFQNLRQCIRSLRLMLELPDFDAESILLATRTEVSLNSANVLTDVGEYEDALDAAARAESPTDRVAHLSRAVDLYRGELLPGFYLDPFTWERQRLAERQVSALHALIHDLESLGDTEKALQFARCAAELDPVSEATCSAFMRLYAAGGMPSAVLRQYQEWETRFREEFGEPPPDSMRELSERMYQLAKMRSGECRNGIAPFVPARQNERSAGENNVLTKPEYLERHSTGSFSRFRPYAYLLGTCACLLLGLFVWAAKPSVRLGARAPKYHRIQTTIFPLASRLSESDPSKIRVAKSDSSRPGSLSVTRVLATVPSTPPKKTGEDKPEFLPQSVDVPPKPQHFIGGSDGASNDVLWVARYHLNPDDRSAEPTSMATDRAGNIYVTGLVDTNTKNDTDYITLKYGPDGKKLWEKRYNGPGDDCDRAKSIAVDEAGNVYITGESDGHKGHGTDRLSGLDIATIKYNADGKPSRTWPDVGFGPGVRRYAGSADGRDSGWKVALDGAGNAYVAGRSWGGDPVTGGTGMDCVLIKYGPDGSELWVKSYPTWTGDVTGGIAIAVDSAGMVYVAAAGLGAGSPSELSPQREVVALKYDPAGSLLWEQHNAGDGRGAKPSCIALDRQDNPIVAGWYSRNGPGAAPHDDYLIVKYSPKGNVIWQHTRMWAYGINRPTNLIVDGHNNIFITGMVGTSVPASIGIVRLNSQGQKNWTKIYSGSGAKFDCFGRALAFDSTGSLYVGGMVDFLDPLNPNTANASSFEYTALLCDTGEGTVRKLFRHRGIALDKPDANCMVIDRDDNIIVTGQARTGKAAGIVTVKYHP